MSGRNDADASFIDLYMDYTRNQESPDSFHLWTAITITGAALGRKCYIDKGYYHLYPNLFCILVAGAAKCRKSTAINLGVRLFKDVETTRIIGGKITPEQFLAEIESLQAESDGINILVHSSELSVFLTKQSYGEPLIHILTDLYDCPDDWTYKTKGRGQTILHNVFLCILAATTPDGIAQGIPPSALNEGFASRILFVYEADTPRRNAFPVLTDREKALSTTLRSKLAELSALSGQFTLTPAAHAWYEEWYLKFMNSTPPDKRLEGLYGRKHDHLLRIAMILAGSYRERVIDIHHCDAADAALSSIESKVSGAFKELGGNDLSMQMSRAVAFLKAFPKIHHSELLRRMYPCDAQTFKGIMSTLTQSGMVTLDPENSLIYLWTIDLI